MLHEHKFSGLIEIFMDRHYTTGLSSMIQMHQKQLMESIATKSDKHFSSLKLPRTMNNITWHMSIGLSNVEQAIEKQTWLLLIAPRCLTSSM